MISVKKISEGIISEKIRSQIKWCSNYCKVKPEIHKGSLRIVEHTNLAYVEPHRVIIKGRLYLFFNEHEYFYVGDLRTKYPLSQLQEYITRH